MSDKIKSKDLNADEAIEAIKAIESEEALNEFISEDEDRKTVRKAATDKSFELTGGVLDKEPQAGSLPQAVAKCAGECLEKEPNPQAKEYLEKALAGENAEKNVTYFLQFDQQRRGLQSPAKHVKALISAVDETT